MIFITSYIVLGFLAIRLLVSISNVCSNPKLKDNTISTYPKVSILVPARNEESNLENLFSEILSITYPNFELILLNDHSSDRTEEILAKHTQKFANWRYINGRTLPQGWIGKNWACHQLAEAAEGDYFLFIDADLTKIHPRAVEASMAYMQKYPLDLLSLFPTQEMKSLGEWLSVPLMHYLLLSLLPLRSIYSIPSSSLAAANGQFMLFKSQTYLKHMCHQRVKNSLIEDVAIVRYLKQYNNRCMALLAGKFVICRMYENFNQSINGFSKNILAGFYGKVSGLLLFLFLISFGWIFVYIYLPLKASITAIVGIFSMRLAISYLANQQCFFNLLLHPLQIINLIYIGGKSIYFKGRRGHLQWKGRKI